MYMWFGMHHCLWRILSPATLACMLTPTEQHFVNGAITSSQLLKNRPRGLEVLLRPWLGNHRFYVSYVQYSVPKLLDLSPGDPSVVLMCVGSKAYLCML